jgi:hypothetical protein
VYDGGEVRFWQLQATSVGQLRYYLEGLGVVNEEARSLSCSDLDWEWTVRRGRIGGDREGIIGCSSVGIFKDFLPISWDISRDFQGFAWDFSIFRSISTHFLGFSMNVPFPAICDSFATQDSSGIPAICDSFATQDSSGIFR